MVINGKALLELEPIKGMLRHKDKAHGVSHGLSEAGYDIRIKQQVIFYPGTRRFELASSVEEFDMPLNLMGILHDKSTWIRQGLVLGNTVLEPNWKGHLTLELFYHGDGELIIPAGAGIGQVIFHQLAEQGSYTGKYQHQADEPVAAIAS